MRKIERTRQFKRDYKREAKGKYQATLDADILFTVTALVSDQPLEPRFCDHPLTGNWKDHRDCHIKADLVLIYQKPDEATLRLVRLGSHSELGF
ncbi:type II toxin-antitoxin system YafQ family toxin [Candidatus Regiella endosymbiont of Tuberolachnus salignus]|uniref:type II toxin-antitoxin system YafQ family toxin n=1 Tax=Candidatus Regiella endosymbiont of Tuberolachnus salignus TaxID=3077956 RepID=UPI0030D36FDB